MLLLVCTSYCRIGLMEIYTCPKVLNIIMSFSVSVLIALAIGLVVWCICRFFKKKRPKDKKKGKDGKDQVEKSSS
jgi:hypothetical protein